MSDGDAYDPFTAPVTTQYYATALLGPFMAGWIAHFILGGVVFTQYAAYIETNLYRQDPRSTKLLLHTVFFLDVACLAFHGEQIFHYGTTQDRSMESVFVSRRVDMIPFLFLGIGSCLLSSFLCRRAAGLFNSNMNYQSIFLWGFHALIGIAFVAQCAAVWLLTSLQFETTPSANQLTGCWLWISSVTDWSFTVTLFLLLKKRFGGNLSSVRKLLSISIQTASYTSILTLLGAVTAIAWPSSDYSTANVLVAFQGPLSSLYALSLTVTLASREERTAVVVGSTQAGVATGDFSDKARPGPRKDEFEDSDEEEGFGENAQTNAALGIAMGEEVVEDEKVERAIERGRRVSAISFADQV